jgi:co-chaperonin GroES (HSP10)
MKMLNDNLLVELVNETTILGNGLAVKETRGKRDIVYGTIVECECGLEKGMKVWFPLYAANPITINGKSLLIVALDDIIMVE